MCRPPEGRFPSAARSHGLEARASSPRAARVGRSRATAGEGLNPPKDGTPRPDMVCYKLSFVKARWLRGAFETEMDPPRWTWT